MNQVYLFGPNNRLSNGSMTRFVLDDIWYNCVEQYMSSQKAKLFGDQEMYEKIMDTWSSQTHKELSRNVRSADPVIWDEKCEEIPISKRHCTEPVLESSEKQPKTELDSKWQIPELRDLTCGLVQTFWEKP